MTQDDILSAREKEVVNVVLQGKSNKQIAAALGISIRTVEFHLKNIYAKYSAASRIELILKLGNTPSKAVVEKLGFSTVENSAESGDNWSRHNSQMDWAASKGAFSAEESDMGKQDEIINSGQVAATILVGCICFGVAMAVRDIVPNIYIRASLAAVAFVIMGLTISRIQQRSRKSKASQ